MKWLKTIGEYALLLLLMPLLLLCAPLSLAWIQLEGVILRKWFWRAHGRHGRRIFFVYSESPNWQVYVEENILPRIEHQAIVLNWSQRRHWAERTPWEARFFHHFAGTRNFNPLAIVLLRSGKLKTIPFYQAFLDFKHGDERALRKAEVELFAQVSELHATPL